MIVSFGVERGDRVRLAPGRWFDHHLLRWFQPTESVLGNIQSVVGPVCDVLLDTGEVVKIATPSAATAKGKV